MLERRHPGPGGGGGEHVAPHVPAEQNDTTGHGQCREPLLIDIHFYRERKDNGCGHTDRSGLLMDLVHAI